MISQRGHERRFTAMSPAASLSIRLSGDQDALELGRLARLDSTLHDGGPALLAVVDGAIWAAKPLAGGPAIADPFRPTADLVALLELRLAQLGATARPVSGVRRAARRLRRYRVPVSA